jgi:hypothetical protein
VQYVKELATGYESHSVVLDEHSWWKIINHFYDANPYQTRSSEDMLSGSRNIRQLVLKIDGKIVAAAQARIKRVPASGKGIAYIAWGHLQFYR